jgi:metal-responsive CopG/Arc/MetJ family transcriptional regulator
MKSSDENQMVHMRIDRALLKRLDDFRFKHRFESRSEAARWLMKLALDQKPVPTDKGKD